METFTADFFKNDIQDQINSKVESDLKKLLLKKLGNLGFKFDNDSDLFEFLNKRVTREFTHETETYYLDGNIVIADFNIKIEYNIKGNSLLATMTQTLK